MKQKYKKLIEIFDLDLEQTKFVQENFTNMRAKLKKRHRKFAQE